MILGMSLAAFTALHVVISLVGIVTGIVVLFGMVNAKPFSGWTAVFLATTVLTSVTGFLFPFHRLLPSHIVGLISLLVLAVAIYARYGRKLDGAWRTTYVLAAMLALYFNMFVLVVQLFEKVPALKAVAPTQTEPPFKVAQLAVLAFFVMLTIFAAVRFRKEPIRAA